MHSDYSHGKQYPQRHLHTLDGAGVVFWAVTNSGYLVDNSHGTQKHFNESLEQTSYFVAWSHNI